MTELVIIFICAVATWQIVDIIHHSEMETIADFRAKQEASAGFFGQLTTCPWCMSVWVGVIAYGIFRLNSYFAESDSLLHEILWAVTSILKFLITGTAVSRISNLLNDYFYETTRTHATNIDEEPQN